MARMSLCLSILIGLAFLGVAPGVAFALNDHVAVLISREISPYIEMVKGLEAGLGSRSVQRYFLDEKGQSFTLEGRGMTLTTEQVGAIVAVGPEALEYLVSRNMDTPLFFGMILNPQNLLVDTISSVCGVALNLSIESQFSALHTQLPHLQRLGILFDSANNQSWFDQAQQIAMQYDIELLSLQVQRKNGRIELVGDFTQPDALMFIPDKSIISQAIIQYVIKQAVLQRIPVVGYNQFFLDSGAALAFVIDYWQIGGQVAQQVESVMAGHPCPSIVPAFALKRNPHVWQALGLPPGKEAP